MKYLIYCFLVLGFGYTASAQVLDSLQNATQAVDAVHIEGDTLLSKADKKQKKLPFVIVPRKATLKSLMLPGLGQAYIRQYWTIPVIYAGFGGLAYGYVINNQVYKAFRKGWASYIYQYYTEGNTTSASADVKAFGTTYTYTSETGLRYFTNTYRRYRDLCIIGAVGLYALQLIEVNVSAHMKTFDNTDDISLHLRPGVKTDNISTLFGVTAVLTLK
ncbi:MAG: DUF5683 domain-containing protein [Siphonobacter sp.]